jgi:hypothetical protein
MHEFVVGLVKIGDPYKQRKVGDALISWFQRSLEIKSQKLCIVSTNHEDIKAKGTKMWYLSA